MSRSPRIPQFLIALGLALATLAIATPDGARAAPGSRSPDGLWTEVEATSGNAPASRFTMLSNYRVVQVDKALLESLLDRAPDIQTPGALTITLPVGGGRYERFDVTANPVFAPEIAPEVQGILGYVGQGIDDPAVTASFVQTTVGFYAFVRTRDGMLFMEPVELGDIEHCVVYRRADLVDSPLLECPVMELGGDRTPDWQSIQGGGAIRMNAPSGGTLSTYRLAVSATGEFTQFFDPGGGNTNTLAQIAASVAAVNAIYMPEVAIRLQVSCNNVFLDPTTDPFTSSDNSGTSIGQNQTTIDANCGGSGGYDIGHVFHKRPSGFSGLAGGNTCNNANKAMGYSSVPNPVPGTMIWIVDQLCHEMGHQFSAAHTFNSDVTGCSGNRVGSSAYEPGSGSTIMAYAAGTRCSFDFPGSNDGYFHGHSFDQITSYRDGGGNCGVNSATGNTPPTVNAGPDYTIPQGTPFTLVATASDADGHPLTYCWEQFDLGPPGDFATNVNGPLMRSRPPISSAARTFPILSDILAGNPTPTEILPLVDRTLNFRCTVRDNRASGGGVNNDAMVLTISGSPFVLTAPNGGQSLHADCLTTVTWTVGGSAETHVNILLSTDGGSTYTALVSNTPNDGSQEVRLPCTTTNQGRVRIEPVGNIYFDVSDANFSIVNADPVASISATGGSVGATCQFQVPFSATLTDDCRLDVSTVQVTASSLDGNATVGGPVYVANVIADDHIEVSGTVLVSALTDCPARVRVSIAVDDRCGRGASDSDDVEVIDDTDPEISVTLSATQLWPPNHKMHTITADVMASDNCPGVTYVLESIDSNEPINGLGDGDTAPDWLGADLNTADTEFELRAERAGNGTGRIYTVTYTATDPCGNSASASAEVLVPHSRNASALAAAGLTPDGESFDPAGTVVAFVVSGASLVVPTEDDLSDRIGFPGDRVSDPPSPGGEVSRWITLAEVGNFDRALAATRIEPLDADGDGLEDFLVMFSGLDVRGLATGEWGPVALHFIVDGRDSYELADVLGHGPVTDFSDEVQRHIDEVVALVAQQIDETCRTPEPEPVLAQSPASRTELPAGAASSLVSGFRGVLPNPFRDEARFAFELARAGAVHLSVFTPAGQAVRQLEAGVLPAGTHSRTWDGRDASGRSMPPGIYIVRLQAPGFEGSIKAVRVR